MNKVFGKRKVACLVLLVTIFLTLLFIFGNSIVPRNESEDLSNKVNETVGEVITAVTGKEDSSLEDFFTNYHRKIAHFLEFAFLGFQVVLLLHFASRCHFPSLLSGALLSFAVASFDEGIQVLTGRGDQVTDIFIDVCGYLSAYLIGALVLYLVFWRRRAKKDSDIYVMSETAFKIFEIKK